MRDEIREFAMRVLLLFICLVTLHAVLSTTNQLHIYNIYGVQMPCGDGPRITGVCCQWKSLSVTCVTTTPSSRLLHSHFPHKLHTSHGQRLLIQQGNYQPTVCYYYNCHQSNKVKGNDTDPALPVASTGFFPGARDFSISHSQLSEVHGNYYVCDYCNTQLIITHYNITHSR